MEKPSTTQNERAKSVGRKRKAKKPSGPQPYLYKVKVLENAPKTPKKSIKPVAEKNPYRTDDFIDIDGKLKVDGFNTYISRGQYKLLKDFNVSGFVVSQVVARRKQTLPRHLRFLEDDIVDNSKLNSRRPSSSVAPSPTKVPFSRIPTRSKSEDSFARQSTAAVVDTNPSETQTLGPSNADEETQTDAHAGIIRRTVEFDLESNKINAYDPESDLDLRQSLSNQSVGFEGVPDEVDRNDVEDLSNDDEERMLFDEKMITALRMIGSILCARELTRQSMDSRLIKNIMSSLPPEDRQQLMDLATSQRNDVEDDEFDEVVEREEILGRLMRTYAVAHNQILGHIKAADAYESRFPNGGSSAVTEKVTSAASVNQDAGEEGVTLPEESDEVETMPGEYEAQKMSEEFMGDGVKQAQEVATFVEQKLNSTNPNFLRYSPELTSDQFKVEIRATQHQLTQSIQFNEAVFNMSYGIRVSTILAATRLKTKGQPISTGNLLLMQNQHATLAGSRIISSKYFMSRTLAQLTALGELFIAGKYFRLQHEDTKTIKPKLYARLREINTFTGLLYQLSDAFVLACKKMLESVNSIIDSVHSSPATGAAATVVIGQPIKTSFNEEHAEYTVPTVGVLPGNDALNNLLSAFGDIDHVIYHGNLSIRSLNQKGAQVRVRTKYYKTVVSFMEAVQQLECGHDLDFGAVLMGFIVDTIMLMELQRQAEESVLDLKKRSRIFQNYHQIYHFLKDLGKLGKKVSLISSFIATKSMDSLHRYRNSQAREIGCLNVFGKIRERKKHGSKERKKKDEKDAISIQDKPAVHDISAHEEDSKRLQQMLAAISNESSISTTIF